MEYDFSHSPFVSRSQVGRSSVQSGDDPIRSQLYSEELEVWSSGDLDLSEENNLAEPTEEAQEIEQMEGWLRCICISDTHTLHRELKIPRGDILFHCGDFTTRGPVSQVQEFNDWLGSLPHKHKVVIAGNHEMALQRFQNEPDKIQQLLTNAHYLQDNSVTIEGVTIYGTPWIARKWIFITSSLARWAFGEVGSMGLAFALPSSSEELFAKWDSIPTGIDFLLTHMPPFNIQDSFSGHHMGCPHLARTVDTRVRPRVHIFGHVHDAHGVHQTQDIAYINAANCLEKHRHPIVFDYHNVSKEIRFVKSKTEQS